MPAEVTERLRNTAAAGGKPLCQPCGRCGATERHENSTRIAGNSHSGAAGMHHPAWHGRRQTSTRHGRQRSGKQGRLPACASKHMMRTIFLQLDFCRSVMAYVDLRGLSVGSGLARCQARACLSGKRMAFRICSRPWPLCRY